jgi:hypothetical protein
MLKTVLKFATVVAMCAALFVGTANAQLKPTPVTTTPSMWSLTVGGVGLTAGDNIGTDWQWGGELGLARQVNISTIKTDVGARQTMAYGTVGYTPWCKDVSYDVPCSDGTASETVCGSDKKDGWMFRTEIFWDVNIPIYKRLSAFVGPNFAVNYGEGLSPTWTVGPEAGLKYDLGKGVFVFTRVNYDWNLSDSQDGFRVASGLGFKF